MLTPKVALIGFIIASVPLHANASDLRVGVVRYDGGAALYGVAENQQIMCDQCTGGVSLVAAAPPAAIRFDKTQPACEEMHPVSPVAVEETPAIEVAPPEKKHGCTVFFGLNKADLTAGEKRKIREALAVGADPSVLVRVDGYACRIGTRKYNLSLSRRRAKAVAAYLASLGVKVVTVDGLGVRHKTGAVVAKDRRAEIIIKESH